MQIYNRSLLRRKMSKKKKVSAQLNKAEGLALRIAILTGRSLLWPANWWVALSRDEEFMSKARNRVLKGGLFLTTVLVAWLAYYYLPSSVLNVGALLLLLGLYILGIVLSVCMTFSVYDEMVAYESGIPLLPAALAKFANTYFSMRFFWSVINGVALAVILRYFKPL